MCGLGHKKETNEKLSSWENVVAS